MSWVQILGFLSEVANFSGYPWYDFPRVSFDASIQQIKKRGFTHSVFSHDADTIFFLEDKRKTDDHFLLAITFADVVKLKNLSSWSSFSNIELEPVSLQI